MIIKFSFIFVHVNKQDFQWLVNLIVVAGFCKYIFLRLSISTLNFEHFNSEIMHGIIDLSVYVYLAVCVEVICYYILNMNLIMTQTYLNGLCNIQLSSAM